MSQVDLSLPILFIDDDAMVREVILEYLASFGLNNILALHDPQKALRVIQDPKVPISLVLSDWEMPSVSGLTLLKAMRKNPKRSATKFIMCTSQKSMERFKITQAAQWHVNAYIVKPFRAEVLQDKIWQVMGWDSESEHQDAG